MGKEIKFCIVVIKTKIEIGIEVRMGTWKWIRTWMRTGFMIRFAIGIFDWKLGTWLRICMGFV